MTGAPRLTPHHDPELHRRQLTHLHEVFAQVSASSRGQVVFCVGQPGSGRTTFLAQLIAELSSGRRQPELIAGGFGFAGVYQGLRAWRLPSRRLDLLTRAGSAASGLGQLVATAAAGAAISTPPGATQTFTSIAAFVGQAAQATGYAAGRSTAPHDARHPTMGVSAGALLHAVRSMLQTGRPLALVLDDLDQAQPAAEWRSLFMERWIAPVLHDAPLLVVVSMLDDGYVTDAAPAASAETCDLPGSLTDSGRINPAQTTTVRVGPLTGDDIATWLDPVDPAVTGDLLVCAGGHPGWTVELFNEWTRHGLIARSIADGTWHYKSADLHVRAKAAEAYVQTLLWELVGHDVEAYDRAERILRLAAIEGTSFTAEVVAKVLHEDPDEVIDWIDDWLCQANKGARSPLVEVGFASLPSEAGAPRHLALYEFRSPLLWAAMHPTYSAAPRDSPDSGANRKTAGAYAEALAETYGRWPGTPFHRIALLYRWAENPYAAAHYQHLGDLTADQAVHRQILKAELDAVQNTYRSTDDWSAARMLGSATRIILACVALQEALNDNILVDYLLQGYRMTEEVTAAAAQLDVQILQAHALHTMANCAYRQEWFGDSLACASSARVLWLGFPDLVEATSATIHCISSYGRLLRELHHGDVKALSRSVRRQLPLALATVLPPGDPETWGGKTVVSAILSKEAHDLIGLATDEVAQIPPRWCEHVEGNLYMARSDLALGEGDLQAAVLLLRSGAEHFDTCQHGELCPRLGEAYARLVGVLWRQKKYQDAEEAARRALYVLLSHASWSRAAAVQLDVSHAYMAAGNRRAAAAATAHGIHICRKGKLQPLEALLWMQLASYSITKPNDGSPLVLECQAMATLRSQGQHEHFVTDLPTRLRGQRHQDESMLDRYLDKARVQWDLDQGANLLQRAAATSEADAEAYLAKLARKPASHA